MGLGWRGVLLCSVFLYDVVLCSVVCHDMAWVWCGEVGLGGFWWGGLWLGGDV